MHCSLCAQRLAAVRYRGLVHYACPRCRGKLATLDDFRRVAGRRQAAELLRGTHVLPRRSARACPVCLRGMTLVTAGEHDDVELDVCRPCRVLWADRGELEAIAAHAVAAQAVSAAPTGAVRRSPRPVPRPAWRRERAPGSSHWPDRWWKFLLAAFGLPVETDSGRFQRAPVVTWSTVFLMVVVTAVTLPNLDAYLDTWALKPANAFHHGGLNWITAFFLHADPFHLLSNAYFLLVFGDNVEEHVGHRRMLLLLVLSALAGSLAHIAVDPSSTVPLVGASGGISGVVVLYALLFPRARVTVFLLIILPVTLPALTMLFLWTVLQFVGAAQQLNGISAISALAHLGGALVGLVTWWLGRHVWSRKAEAIPGP